jgi:Flp pilus assembly protein TadD
LTPALLALAAIVAACSSPSVTSSADALITSGVSAESAGHFTQAESDFTSAAKKDPADAVAYYDLGALYQEHLNEVIPAENAYNKALLADPNDQSAMFNLAILETPGDPQGAIALYDQLLKLNANDVNVSFNLGLLLISEGQKVQGQADITHAIFLDPKLKSRLPAGVSP